MISLYVCSPHPIYMNQVTDFHETLYKRHVTTGHPTFVVYLLFHYHQNTNMATMRTCGGSDNVGSWNCVSLRDMQLIKAFFLVELKQNGCRKKSTFTILVLWTTVTRHVKFCRKIDHSLSFLSFFLNRPLLPCGVEEFLLVNLLDNW
jgi:hypothetical protein